MNIFDQAVEFGLDKTLASRIKNACEKYRKNSDLDSRVMQCFFKGYANKSEIAAISDVGVGMIDDWQGLFAKASSDGKVTWDELVCHMRLD